MKDLANKPWIGFAVVAYGFLAAAFFAFGIYGRQSMIDATIDLNCFGEIARNLVEGKGFSLGHGPTVRRAPLYPLLGAGLLALFGDDTPGISPSAYYRPLIVANCVFFGLTCLVVFQIAKRLFDARVALLAVLLCPLFPQSLRYVGMTEVETLMGLFIALLALTGLRLAERPSWATGAVFGLALAGATLSKAVAMLYPLAFAPFALYRWRRLAVPVRTQLVAVGLAALCFAAPLVPWSLRNVAVTDGAFRGVSSNGPGEFLRGYINAQPKYFLLRQNFGGGDASRQTWDPEANAYEARMLERHGMPFYVAVRNSWGRLSFDPPLPPGVPSAEIEVKKDRIQSAEMKRRLLEEPLGFVKKTLVQLGTFWYIVETRLKSVLVGGIALVTLSLSVIGAFEARRRSAPVWPVLLVIAYFNALYAAFLALARYSMPLYPTLAALAAGGIAVVVARVSSVLRARLAKTG